MARYSAFLGRQVEVQYRAGDILLPASGTFVGDTGRSIFLEQSFEQRGQRRHFRWEIPYQYVVRLAEKIDVTAPKVVHGPPENPTLPSKTAASDADAPSEHPLVENVASAAAGGSSKISVIFPRPQRSNV
ncbi:MAG TPA: hypothetical protein VGH83_11405 [Candidatus Acidoferrum sp.]|jgi:hypothetical protein